MAHTYEMAAGGAERCVCLSVLIGTGLKYAKLGLSGNEKTSRQPMCHLLQVSDLMANSIAKASWLGTACTYSAYLVGCTVLYRSTYSADSSSKSLLGTAQQAAVLLVHHLHVARSKQYQSMC